MSPVCVRGLGCVPEHKLRAMFMHAAAETFCEWTILRLSGGQCGSRPIHHVCRWPLWFAAAAPTVAEVYVHDLNHSAGTDGVSDKVFLSRNTRCRHTDGMWRIAACSTNESGPHSYPEQLRYIPIAQDQVLGTSTPSRAH